MRVTETKKIERYYQALVERETNFVGIFYAGVKTTGVFCIATCRARKPKPENVNFYTNIKTALDEGYRPCKICKPTQNAHQAPEEVEAAIQLIQQNPKLKITDDKLREQGISPEPIRRWFKKHYGMTFHAYQRMSRINQAFQELKNGKTSTETAFDSAYDSLSGFGYTYKKLMGKSPSQTKGQSPILINRLTTPLSPMYICSTERGICMLEFVDRDILEADFASLQKYLQAPILWGENDHIKQARKELKEYFAGERQQFELALDMPGTDFQQSIWQALTKVPYGETATYGALAVEINNPKAVRAVGAANGANRIAIVVPCHRIIGKNGKLTGYGGGLDRKSFLLETERKVVGKPSLETLKLF
ncbi:MAG: bifunctional transcriptional activator/DNA repair enzyme AdaA [Bacteroidia bacterium]